MTSTRLLRFVLLFSLGVLLILLIAQPPAPPIQAASSLTSAQSAPIALNKPGVIATLTPVETNILVIQSALIPPAYYADLPVINR
jgi:hypothetical protein